VITVLFLTDTSFRLSAKKYKKISRVIEQKCLKYLTFRKTVFDGKLWMILYKKETKASLKWKGANLKIEQFNDYKTQI
jgi:hypothetical protein